MRVTGSRTTHGGYREHERDDLHLAGLQRYARKSAQQAPRGPRAVLWKSHKAQHDFGGRRRAVIPHLHLYFDSIVGDLHGKRVVGETGVGKPMSKGVTRFAARGLELGVPVQAAVVDGLGVTVKEGIVRNVLGDSEG